MSKKMDSTFIKPFRQTWPIAFQAFQAIILIACFVFLYAHTILEMMKNWQRDDNFSHGFLIPFITAYMIWQKRDSLSKETVSPSNWGIMLLVLSMVMHIAGAVSAETFSMRSSMIVCLLGVVLFLWGQRVLLEVGVPLLYLVFMIPIPKIIWNQIAFPMQLLASKFSYVMLQLFHIPVLREGNIIQLSNITLEVVDACSGLRSLTSLLSLSGVFAYISLMGLPSRWILFLSAVPIALLVNIIRITATGVLSRYMGPETANGFLHGLSGILIFAISILMLLGIKGLLGKCKKK